MFAKSLSTIAKSSLWGITATRGRLARDFGVETTTSRGFPGVKYLVAILSTHVATLCWAVVSSPDVIGRTDRRMTNSVTILHMVFTRDSSVNRHICMLYSSDSRQSEIHITSSPRNQGRR
jgi:hypothetical protein